MTAALAHRVSAAPTGQAAPATRPASRLRPRLMPVPDSEPPFSPLPDGDDATESPFTAAAWRHRIAVAERLRLRARVDPGPTVEAPLMAHRRWAPDVSIEALRARTPQAAPRAAAPVPHHVHSAVGILPSETYPEPGAATLILPAAALPAPMPGITAALPSATDAGTVLVRATIEALSGRRPISQLRRHYSSGVFSGLEDFPMLGRRTQLVSLWVCEPTDDIAEVSAAFRCGTRTRALAMQLRCAENQWYVTALQIG